MKTREPIAIVGIGCRFPGGSNSPEEFWRMLRNGVDAVIEVPADRWDADSFYDPEFTRKNRISVRSGGFIDEIDKFDAGFFGISPREAAYMDPQQRILLEVAYQALEDAGQRMETLSGSRTGVFIGISSHDYGDIQTSPTERIHIGPHTMVGGANSIASNRISYLFNLKGPSLSIDTACSSALNAAHVACQCIWNDDCDKALVGGVNIILRPEITMAFSKGGFLSPDGRSFSFDDRANGYIRSEGAGIFLLKPLSKALEDEDRIYAAIIGSAVNQDGATAGISFPSEEAQKEMLREAYERAGISPADVQYIEAHGTGTAAGDPVEARALGEVIGAARAEGNPCIINSVKANIGHLESASGIAGMIKLALSMHHGEIPGNIHFKNPNPKIPFERLNLTVPGDLRSWPDTDDGVIHGGVTSFGFGGANAHIVMQRRPDFDSVPRKGRNRGSGRRPGLFTLSARGSDSLKAYAKKFSEYLGKNGDNADVSLDDICYSAGVRKSHLSHRLAAVVRTQEELRDLLDGFVRDEASEAMHHGRPFAAESPGAVFIYSGQGPQWWAMGRELYEDEPVFRESIAECDAMIVRHAGWSLIREFTTDEARSRIHETPVAQPSIFALQVALTRLWVSLGVEPSAVVGHSVGEVAAAHVSGHLALEDAVRVILNRSRVQHRASGKGRMLAVGLSEEQAREEIAGFEDRVSVAAINAPEMVTLSGDAQPLEVLARDLDRRDIFHRFLRVPIPFHSHHMDPLKDELVSSLQGLRLHPTNIPLYSTVTGARVEKDGYDPEYWFRNVRWPVRFVEAIRSLIADGFDAYFVEISPHPILSGGVNDLLEEAGRQGLVVPSLRRKHEEMKTLLGSLGSLHTMGFEADLGRVPEAGGFVRLPFYPWKKERHWIESEASRTVRLGLTSHPFLRDRTASAGSENEQVCRVDLDVREHAYLADHKVQGPIIFPGAGYVELAVSAALDSYENSFRFLEDIRFERVLFLPEDGAPPTVQLEISGSEGSFQIASRSGKDRDWVRHVSGKIRHMGNVFHSDEISLSEIRKRVTDVVPIEELYTELYDSGLDLGPTFQGIERLWRKDRDDCHGESVGEIIVPESLRADFHRYNLHPAILDACFQALFGSAYVKRDPHDRVGVYIPIHIRRVKFHRKPTERLWSYCRLLDHGPDSITGDIWIFDDRGRTCAEFQGFKGRYLEGSRGDQETVLSRCLYEHRWTVSERPSQARIREPERYLPSPPSLEAGLSQKTEEIRARPLQEEYYEAFEPELNRLASAYIVYGLRELGFPFRPEAPFTPESLADDLGVAGPHRKLFTRMLEILEEDGLLETDGTRRNVARAPENTDPENLHRALSKGFPAFAHELALLGRCGPHIAGVLRGEVDPVLLLFPEEEWDAIVTFYRESFSFRKYNEIVRESIRLLLAGLPEDQTLRILEIGAGTGGVTSVVLPLLPAERTEYTFTDLSTLFLVKAQERFHRTYPFMKFQRFDVEEDVDGQGPDPHGYDLVIASDVLHATRSLRHTLSNVQDLLASRGTLLLLEVTRCPWWLDLVFGMTEGWWRFNDLELRPNHPSLSGDRWTGLLEEMGFSDVLGVTDAAEGQSAQHVFLARNRRISLTAPAAELPEAVADHPGNWLLFSDRNGVGDRLAEKLRARGQACTLVTQGEDFQPLGVDRFSADPSVQEHVDQLLRHVTGDDTPLHGIFHLWSLDSGDNGGLSADSLERSCVSGLTSVLNLVRALTDLNMDPQPNLWLITAGSQPVGAENGPVSVEQAPLWGLGRVIMNEHPGIPCTCVDLGPAPGEDEIDSFFQEICQDRQEEEVALRGGKRYLHKLLRVSPEAAEERAMKPVTGGRLPFRLTIDAPGMLDNLRFRETAPAVPGPGEVEIEVAAAGLNFKDVMIAMGLLDEAVFQDVYTGTAFGVECSGRVLSVGEGVTGFSAGDEVVALGPACFGAAVITNRSLVRKKPARLTHEEAATIPLAYLTASYSLLHLGRLSRGEKVLIHSASGGVGLAALSLARLAGAEVFATAGSEKKRDFLRSLGVEHVMDSRALDFADQVLEATSGRGVDLVLNSLSKNALSRSIDVLAPYGRFIEIGKTDIYGNTRLGLRPFADNLSYFAVDIDKLMLDRAELCGEILGTCLERFEDGSLTPAPLETFPASRVTDAFRFMAQAKQVGKVVVTMNQGPVWVAPSRDISSVLRGNASYLITGGCSGFGLSVARWLADRGARHLVLVSRSGVKTVEEEQAVREMRNEGVRVLVAKADVTREDEVAGVMRQVEREMPPLRGVIHAAMVLDDTILTEINHEKLMKVVRPKALGAWNLHRETLGKPLDFFLSFSSMSSIYGNAGQGNYSAANAFLDAFSHYRRSLGLPATTINWGVIGEVGYVARNVKVSNILASQGWKSFNRQQTAAILEHILLTNPVQAIALDADWSTVARFYPMALKSPRFAHLVLEAMDTKSGAGGPSSSLRQALLDTPPEKRGALLREQLHEQVARIIGTSSAKIDVQDPISAMGLDSLMANQLRNWIQQNLQLDFSMMRIMRGPSILELSGMLAEDLHAQKTRSAPAEPGAGELDMWVIRNNLSADTQMRLFCFPYMAGGASVFFDWAEFLPRHIEVCSIQMPGREERSGEEPFQDIDTLVGKLAGLILPLLDKPFAFYGHSFGAGIGFKLSHYLFAKLGLLPEHLFIGAWLAPHLPSPFRVLDRIKGNHFTGIPESLIFEHLRRLEMPESVLSNAELMNEMMPSIRADMMMGKRYTHSEDTPLPCRITAFAGSEDTVFSVDQIRAWSRHSIDGFHLEVIPGGHLFLNENKGTLLKVMSDILSPQKP